MSTLTASISFHTSCPNFDCNITYPNSNPIHIFIVQDYGELMSLINEMTKTRSIQRVNDQGKNMLKRLFPPWLLTQYKWMFAAPFPEVRTCVDCTVLYFDLWIFLLLIFMLIVCGGSFPDVLED